MKVTKYLALMGCLLLSSQIGKAQLGWTCDYDWAAGQPIGGAYLQQIPDQNVIQAGPGATIQFAVRFGDLDEASGLGAACVSPGPHQLQFDPVNYQITFTSDNPDATFGGMPMVTVNANLLTLLPNPTFPAGSGIMYAVLVSSNATLQIGPGWTAADGPITITATITDLSGPVMPPHTGNPMDPDLVVNWTLNFNNNCPNALSRVTLVPADGVWTNIGGGIGFTYQGQPDPPPTYQGSLILETFAAPVSGGIFTMADLEPAWVMANGVVTADQAAAIIFSPAQPATFALNANNQFEDFHAGFGATNATIGAAFTLPAINAGHAGYRIPQTYSCNGMNIGTANLDRRLQNAAGVRQFRKTHMF